MKNIRAAVTILVLVLAANTGTFGQSTADNEWQKSTTAAWQGKNDTITYWYSFDAEGRLALTSDNQKWVLATQPLWSDYEGKQYRISGTELMMSSDTGKTWTKSPTRFWRGSDGMWYGFDDNWALWTGGNGNNPPVGVIGTTTPNAGTDAYTGTNANGETSGINGNGMQNETNIKLPNTSNTNSGGIISGAQQNNMNNGPRTGGTNLPPK